MIGEIIGNFRIVRELGKGGMGTVWLAEHKEIKTKVAIKMLLPHVSADKNHVQRFFNEAVAVSQIKHSGIAKIFDVGFRATGEAYLVMEFLDGEPLSTRIARPGRLPLIQIVETARQIASVLQATHAEGITHRDLKPENVYIVRDDEMARGERVKVLDFGIAKLATSQMTSAGMMGTPAYMSPEQWKNSAKVDGRADIYSLGCLMFEMACSRPPFIVGSVGEACEMHTKHEPPRARTLSPTVMPALDDLIARLLAKAPEARPTLREIRTELGELATMIDAADPNAATLRPPLRPSAPGASSSAGIPLAAASLPMPVAPAAPPPSLPVAPVHATTLSSSAAMSLGPRDAPAAPRRSRAPWIAAAVIVIGAGAVAATQLGGSGDGEGNAPVKPAAASAPATAPPSNGSGSATGPTSHVTIATQPPGAQLTIDDAPVANPYDGSFPTTKAPHHIRAVLAGYQQMVKTVRFDVDTALTLRLVADHTPAGKATHTP